MRKGNVKIFAATLCGLLISGCASKHTLYQWGDYDVLLYQSYKNPEKSEAFRQGLELHLMKMEQSQQKAAPGLYAELGTLYLQGGNRVKAVSFYTKERDAWPESRALMDALIKNIDKPMPAKAEVKS